MMKRVILSAGAGAMMLAMVTTSRADEAIVSSESGSIMQTLAARDPMPGVVEMAQATGLWAPISRKHPKQILFAGSHPKTGKGGKSGSKGKKGGSSGTGGAAGNGAGINLGGGSGITVGTTTSGGTLIVGGGSSSGAVLDLGGNSMPGNTTVNFGGSNLVTGGTLTVGGAISYDTGTVTLAGDATVVTKDLTINTGSGSQFTLTSENPSVTTITSTSNAAGGKDLTVHLASGSSFTINASGLVAPDTITVIFDNGMIEVFSDGSLEPGQSVTLTSP